MRRITELDALRGVAAVAITIYHLKPQAMPLGWAFVDLFMVLSGYLITTIILRNAGRTGFLTTFYARRSLRIWPVYFLALGAIVAVNPLLPKRFPMDALPYYLTFTQNVPRYWSSTVPPFHWYFLHTWSVALEEQFYLVWPAIVCLAGRRRLVPASLIVLAIAVVSRAWGAHWWLLIARCDGFALGGLLAAIVDTPHRRALKAGLGAAGLAGAAMLAATVWVTAKVDFETAMSLGPSLTILAINLVDFSLIGLVVIHANAPWLALLRSRPLVQLGQISFGLYLFHPLVILALSVAARRFGLPESAWFGAIEVAACIGVASLSWIWFERPILALKERFAYGRNSEPAIPIPPGSIRSRMRPHLSDPASCRLASLELESEADVLIDASDSWSSPTKSNA